MENKLPQNREKNEINNFLKEENLSFLYLNKKCEKISSVLYVLSARMKDSEPLKYALRGKAVALALACAKPDDGEGREVIVFSEDDTQKRSFAFSLGVILTEIQTLLHVAYAGGYISKMNAGVIIGELSDLLSFVRRTNQTELLPEGPVLSVATFLIDEDEKSVPNKKDITRASVAENKRQRVVSDTGNDLRKRLILNIIIEKGVVSIKDISSRVTDCSEKTIQRVLSGLVDEGVVERKGSRRWSTYSIKNTESTTQ